MIVSYLGINHYNTTRANYEKQINLQQVSINELELENNGLQIANIDLSAQLKSNTIDYLSIIEPIKYTDKKAYLTLYKNIIEYATDQPEDIYSCATKEEIELICSVIEAEAGICDFNGKTSVANVIVNRYMNSDKTWTEILKADGQFSTISNGSYKRVTISDDTRLSLEYAFLFGDDKSKDAMYFRSGGDNDSWHNSSDKLEEVYFDDFHHFYRLKEGE